MFCFKTTIKSKSVDYPEDLAYVKRKLKKISTTRDTKFKFQMKNKNHICFDLDGVLIDSIDLMKYCWENTAKKFNINCKFEEFSALIGLPLTSITSILEIPDSAKFIENYKNLSYQNLDKIKIDKDTVNNLKKISSNYKISIYTSKTHQRVEKIIDKFFKSLQFDSILTSDDVLHSKPDQKAF